MVGLLPDGDFELELWSLGGAAEYTTSYPLTGNQALLLNGLKGGDSATSQVFDVTAGSAAVLSLWAWAQNVTDTLATVSLKHYPNGIANPASTIWSKKGTDFAHAGSYENFILDITPTTSQDKLYFSVAHAGGFGGNTFRIDDVRYLQGESAVAVKLAERGVNAVVSCLQTYLATELTAIDTDRADGITMAAPANANYYKRPKAEITGATAHVEVFEGGYEFRNPYVDSGDSRAVYDLPVTVRVTYFNRSGDTRDKMCIRMRRYSAGVFNAISKHSELADSDDATQIAGINSVTPPWESITETEPGTFKGSITLQLTVRCEEVQS